MSSKNFSDSGFSILEMIVTISLGAILTGIVAVSSTGLNNPARHGAVSLASFLEGARAQAISSTGMVIVRATTTGSIQGYLANACDEVDPPADDQLLLNLPNDYALTDITWQVCFSARGFAAPSVKIPLSDIHGQSKTVQVYEGGGIRVL